MNASWLLRLSVGLCLLAGRPFLAPLAAVLTVSSLADSGPGTLRAAIESANALAGENEIVFAVSGVIQLLSALPEVTEPLAIDGGGAITLLGFEPEYYEGPPMLTVHSGVKVSLARLVFADSPAGAIANAGSLTVVACEFRDNPYLGDEGGAIRNRGALRIEDSLFSGNRSQGIGGAIYSTGSLSLKNVRFERNLATESGGAIYSRGRLEGTELTFDHNQVDWDFGGAIYHAGGSAAITHSRFAGNFANNGGGAIYNRAALELHFVDFDGNGSKWGAAVLNDNASMTFTDGAIFNQGAQGGSGIENYGGELELVNVTIRDTYTYDYGGALLNLGTATLTQVTIENNTSVHVGGGIVNAGGALRMTGSRVANNEAGEMGGGIYNRGALLIENSEVEGNTAGIDGGGIYITEGATVSLSGAEIRDNHADASGGGTFNSGELNASGVTFSGNTAATGGGVWNSGAFQLHTSGMVRQSAAEDGGAVYNLGQATFFDAHIHDNTAGWNGGGIYNLGALQLSGSNVFTNAAEELGGGLYNSGQAEVSGVVLSGNQGDEGGGAIASIGNGARLTLDHSALTGNASKRGGGLANLSFSHATLVNNTFSGNLGSDQGGAIFNAAVLELSFSTLAENSSALGAVIYSSGALPMTGVIASQSSGDNCAGGLEAVGIGNLSDDRSCPGFIVADALLGPIETQEHFHLLPVYSLQTASPAIDNFPPGSCAVGNDQNHNPRPIGPSCDSGAYEAPQLMLGLDIKPKAAANLIRRGQKHVSVAILSDSSHSAPELAVWDSLTFGHSGHEDSLARAATGAPACKALDINADGRPDLVCNFVVSKTGFVDSDSVGYLKGLTSTGWLFFGKDSISVRGSAAPARRHK